MITTIDNTLFVLKGFLKQVWDKNLSFYKNDILQLTITQESNNELKITSFILEDQEDLYNFWFGVHNNARWQSMSDLIVTWEVEVKQKTCYSDTNRAIPQKITAQKQLRLTDRPLMIQQLNMKLIRSLSFSLNTIPEKCKLEQRHTK